MNKFEIKRGIKEANTTNFAETVQNLGLFTRISGIAPIIIKHSQSTHSPIPMKLNGEHTVKHVLEKGHQ
ncbi:hypothetical protein BK727_20100 [Bacillus thuringiensis serovar roskildiensis]|uniref:Uncharacterized protein n=1 Tax=Bacillus thuringiensis serovar sooncheon TaxID=180891 RepID=A0A9Q5SGB4_BACTU|nr:hypothetical protein [Bacillus thuringiensis]MEB9661405.1 hypothetical protein [Bacillus cereus]ARV91313.1 hypothetical protein BJG91_01215 [Bacillus thuringiensis]OTW69801.1 hypothetical protein BK707_14080 [Bacillus thuringiensis serovar coreanensis]OTX42743.1 hypothetical protein BK724_24100 [Bacillus thuringiensis serovar sooncheon]OTX50808.1 hypothetical protein BK725_23130 [Bacillus thuringiensis serovar guiyangiensis]